MYFYLFYLTNMQKYDIICISSKGVKKLIWANYEIYEDSTLTQRLNYEYEPDVFDIAEMEDCEMEIK